jgi:transglutaminase-like putative cysteine protease
MSETPSPLLPDDEQTRDRLRAVLVVFCAVAIVLAGTVVPAISGAGLGETPLGSAVPQPGVDPFSQQPGSAGGGSGSGGLGALNPGDQTGVGGSLADDESAFRSQNAEVHFTVKSSVPTYWRTGAYDTYTGSGWERSGDREPYTGPIEGDGIEGQRVEYQVQLDQSATALPSVWRANSVSQIDGNAVSVTDQGAFVTEEPLPAGTTYSGVSHLPPRDPTVLKTAGRDYPTEVERRYTDLPDDADPRLGEFTSNLTADADSPYESAKQIESWLEANKDYSLTVSEPGGEIDVASQFVFEMEKGYCEYFATAMTVMLRSQGVPARYVVGYSTGQQVGENTYKVRGMNAHAWVEVYFPDVGWVRFDPTPGQDRLEAEQQAFENQTDSGEYESTERGSPDEEFSTDGSTETTTSSETATETTGDTDDDSTATTESSTQTSTTPTDATTSTTTSDASTTEDGDDSTRTTTTSTTTSTDESQENTNGSSGESEYEVELDRTPVPGATVEVTVTRNETPVAGIPVYFNGEQVGVTDDAGTVTGEVPYARNLTITVGGEESEKTAARGSPPPDFDAPMALEGGPPRPLLFGDGYTDHNETNETSETEYSLATNATLTISGDVVAGNVVVVTATVQDVAVRDAEVRLGGERVGTTDENGRVRIQLPDSPGNVTLAVSRGPVSGEKTVTIPNLTVSVEPTLPLALPGTSVEIEASYGGEPLSNASVRVADANQTTDFNGTASVTLPFEGSANVVVSAHGQTSRTTVTGLFVNLFAVLGGAALVLGGLGFGAYRRGFGPHRLAGLLVAGLRALPGLVVAGLFGVADRLEWALETVLDALRELRAGEATVGELLARLRAWLGERALAAWATVETGTGRTGADASTDRDEDSYRTLREAWRSFLETVSVRRPDAMTPGELADHAVREDDLPSDAVATLRDAFRDVEYGARSPADRLPRVEDAVETIERTTREAEDGSNEAEDGSEFEDESQTTPSTAGGEH